MLMQLQNGLIEYTPTSEPLFIWDVENDRLYADAAVADLFSIRTELVQGGLALECFLQRIHPDDRGRVADAIDRSVQSKSGYSEVYAVVAEDGSQRLVLARGACYGVDGHRSGLFAGTLLDLTEVLDSEEGALARIGDLCIEACQIARRHQMDFLGHLLGMTLLETGNELARVDRKPPIG